MVSLLSKRSRTKLYDGRWTGQCDRDYVLFICGARLNRPWKVRPLFRAVLYAYKMRTWLLRNPQHGMIHAERGIVHGCPVVISYWRSFDELEAFSRDSNLLHVPAWKWYMSTVHKTGDFGFWHEMYQVHAAESSGIYAHMPRVGVARIGQHAAITRGTQTAAERMRLRQEGMTYGEVLDNAASENGRGDRASGDPVTTTSDGDA